MASRVSLTLFVLGHGCHGLSSRQSNAYLPIHSPILPPISCKMPPRNFRFLLCFYGIDWKCIVDSFLIWVLRFCSVWLLIGWVFVNFGTKEMMGFFFFSLLLHFWACWVDFWFGVLLNLVGFLLLGLCICQCHEMMGCLSLFLCYKWWVRFYFFNPCLLLVRYSCPLLNVGYLSDYLNHPFGVFLLLVAFSIYVCICIYWFHLVLVGLLSFLGFFKFVYIAFINNCVCSGSKIGLVSLIAFLDLLVTFVAGVFLNLVGF